MVAVRLFGAVLVLVLGILGTQSQADPDFELNARGMTLNAMVGRTMVAATRDGSSVFSIYLDRDRTAYFHNANGKQTTGKWRTIDAVILCFTGLNPDKPADEVCKRAPENGRGLDWMTVTLHRKDGAVTWSKTTTDEHRGSSQLVYSFAGRVEVNQDSLVDDVAQWAGHLIVGRTLKDREAWFAQLANDGSIDFVFGSGKRFTGSYTLSGGEVCMQFPTNPDADGCRRPTVKGDKTIWANSRDGTASSEIVFMKKTEAEGPREVLVLADNGAGYFSASPDRRIAVVQDKESGPATIYNLETGQVLGKLRVGRYTDAEFSPDGMLLALVQENGVELFDTRDGRFKGSIQREKGGARPLEAAFLSPSEVVIGDWSGQISVHSTADGRLLRSAPFGSAKIADMAANGQGQIGIADTTGQIAVLDRALVRIKGLSAHSSDGFNNVAMTGDGTRFLAVSKTNDAYLMDLTGTDIPVRSMPMPALRLASVSVAPDNRSAVVGMQGKIVIVTLPDLQTAAEWNMGDATINRAVFLADGSTLAISFDNGRFALWAPDTAAALARKARPKPAGLPPFARPNDRQREEMKMAALADQIFVKGQCVAYDRLRFGVRLADRQSDCEAAKLLRQQRMELNSALAALNCDKAADVSLQMGEGKQKVAVCRERVQRQANESAFDAAMALGDCAAIRTLGASMNRPEAGVDCDLAKALTSDKPRVMYLTAVQLDTSGDRVRARRLYTEIMTRFPDDDLAIDAANRLTALADLQTMEERAADQAASQAAALKAAEDRAKVAEAAAKTAAKQAEQDRFAREAAARAADQAQAQAAAEALRAAQAAAANQAANADRCPGIYQGKQVEIDLISAFLKRKSVGTFVVIGLDRRSGLMSVRSVYGSSSIREFYCSDAR